MNPLVGPPFCSFCFWFFGVCPFCTWGDFGFCTGVFIGLCCPFGDFGPAGVPLPCPLGDFRPPPGVPLPCGAPGVPFPAFGVCPPLGVFFPILFGVPFAMPFPCGVCKQGEKKCTCIITLQAATTKSIPVLTLGNPKTPTAQKEKGSWNISWWTVGKYPTTHASSDSFVLFVFEQMLRQFTGNFQAFALTRAYIVNLCCFSDTAVPRAPLSNTWNFQFFSGFAVTSSGLKSNVTGTFPKRLVSQHRQTDF